jgi:hypothetical protein
MCVKYGTSRNVVAKVPRWAEVATVIVFEKPHYSTRFEKSLGKGLGLAVYIFIGNAFEVICRAGSEC